MSVASVAPARHSRMNVGFFKRSQMELDGETREKRQRVRVGQRGSARPEGNQWAGEPGASASPPEQSGGGVRLAENRLQERKPLNQPYLHLGHSSALAWGETRATTLWNHLGAEPGVGGWGRRLSPSPGLARSLGTGTGTES